MTFTYNPTFKQQYVALLALQFRSPLLIAVNMPFDDTQAAKPICCRKRPPGERALPSLVNNSGRHIRAPGLQYTPIPEELS